MPFELQDFQDLLRLLREHPEWREELRALLLTQELLTLPALGRELAEGQQRLVVQMGEVRGWALEQRYHTQAPSYFGRFLRRVQPVDVGRLADALRERLAAGDLADVLLADLILTGRLSTPGGVQAIWVVLEVSTTVDPGDVERAPHRAAVLRPSRYPAVAVAAGLEATANARQAARYAGVALLLDGRIGGWQDALERALSNGRAGSRNP